MADKTQGGSRRVEDDSSPEEHDSDNGSATRKDYKPRPLHPTCRSFALTANEPVTSLRAESTARH